LAAAKDLHPEIANVVQALVERLESLRNVTEETAAIENSKDLTLSQDTASPENIRRFIDRYGSAQLLRDRRNVMRVKLPRTVYTSGSILHSADALVRRATTTAGNLRCSVEKLAENLILDKRTALPHPMWTTRHDAVLIHAISKHGWINQDSAARAVADDNAIKWGAPFGTGKSGVNTNSNVNQISAAAERVVDFFNKYSKMFYELKGFNQQHVISAYGLCRISVDDDRGIYRWVVDGFGTSSTEQVRPIDLPPKKDLVKRAKAILFKSATILPDRNRESGMVSRSHQYTELDQRDGSNVFLAELLRAILKESTNSVYIKKLCSVASEEARLHATALPLLENGDPSESAVSLRRIASHIDETRMNILKAATQSKNVARVILGEEAVKPRNKDESMFPATRSLRALETTTADKVKSRAIPSSQSMSFGEKAVNLARERLLQRYENTDGTSANSQQQHLELTEIETIILSTVCSVGIPIWVDDWETMVSSESSESMNSNTRLTWEQFGKAVTKRSEKNSEKELEKLKKQRAKFESIARGGDCGDRRSAESILEFALYNYKCKEMVAVQAREYTLEPETLAKKAIMLLEKLRRHMTAVIVSTLTARSDYCLGSKILIWFRKELLKWATSLDLLDDDGQPLAYTAVEFLDELPESERLTIEVSSMFDRKGSRFVFGQAAMITRIRSIYITADLINFLERLAKVSNNLTSSRELWDGQPPVWNPIYDATLVKRLLENGLSDRLLVNTTSLFQGRELHSDICCFADYRLSKESLQIRANQLARELHVCELADRSRFLEERRNGHALSHLKPQQKPDIYPRIESDNDDIELISPSRGESYSDVEIVESWQVVKRKLDSKGTVGVEKKHRAC
jgi:hypothetical protein